MRSFTKFLFRFKLNGIKRIDSRSFSEKPQNTALQDKTNSQTTENASSFAPPLLHKPSNLDRTLLVWTGKYKSKDEIPKHVPIQYIERAKNKARIKIANYMMLATVIGCIIMVITGRRAAERGDSLTKRNLEWHRQIKEGEK